MSQSWAVLIDGGRVEGITLNDASITYGRKDIEEAPTPNHATLTLLTADLGPRISDKWPDFGPGAFSAQSGYIENYDDDEYIGVNSRLTPGASVAIDDGGASGYEDTYTETYVGDGRRRFTGRVVALDYTYGSVKVTAVDNLEPLTRIKVATARPAETDRARVAALAATAGVDITFDGYAAVNLVEDTGTTTASVFSIIATIAANAGALFYCDRDGIIHYRAADAIDPAAYTIPGEITLLDDLALSVDLGEIANTITVEYGSPKKKIELTDEDSIAEFGVFTAGYSTILADAADAMAYAERIIARRKSPAWNAPDAKITLVNAPSDVLDAAASIDIDHSITIGPMPPGAPYRDYTADVLGYTEELAYPDWLITLNLAPVHYVERKH